MPEQPKSAPVDYELARLRLEMVNECARAEFGGGQDRIAACNRARAAYYARLAALDAEGSESNGTA